MARVIIVDENLDTADLLARGLEFRGHQVRLTADRRVASSQLAMFQPDVVIIDVGRSEAGGYEVVQFANKLPFPPRVVVVSSLDDPAAFAASRLVGADLHLVKPLTTEEIDRAIQSLLP